MRRSATCHRVRVCKRLEASVMASFLTGCRRGRNSEENTFGFDRVK